MPVRQPALARIIAVLPVLSTVSACVIGPVQRHFGPLDFRRKASGNGMKPGLVWKCLRWKCLRAWSRCRCVSGEHSPGADQSARGEPSPGADVGRVSLRGCVRCAARRPTLPEVNALTVDLDLGLRQSAVEHRPLLLPAERILPANARAEGQARRPGILRPFSSAPANRATVSRTCRRRAPSTHAKSGSPIPQALSLDKTSSSDHRACANRGCKSWR